MKIYIVTMGKFVDTVWTTRGKAEKRCREWGGRYSGASEHRFDEGMHSRTDHRFRDGTTGRWNLSGYTITETEIGE